MKFCISLLILSFFGLLSATEYTIFPQTYSQFFNASSTELSIDLTEAFFDGEENTAVFGISLWVKLFSSSAPGAVFSIARPTSITQNSNNFPEIYYSASTIQLIWENPDYSYAFSQTLSQTITPSTNWFFIGISASYPLKTSLLCVNEGAGSNCDNGVFDYELNLAYDSIMTLGGTESFSGRIGDFRIHNNVYLQLLDWNTQYATRNTCPNGCGSIDVCYSQSNQWCGSFLPLVQPKLWDTSPYFTVSATQTNKIITNSNEIYFGKNSPLSASTDVSVTGWIRATTACGSGTMILKVMQNTGFTWGTQNTILGLSMAAGCTGLTARVFDNIAGGDKSVTISGFVFKSTWAFFAVTSSATQLTVYASTSLTPTSQSVASGSTVTLAPASIWVYVGGSDSNSFNGDYADIRLYPGIALGSVAISTQIFAHVATFKDPICLTWSDVYTCSSCSAGYYIVNGMCQRCDPGCDSCDGNTELDCFTCASGYYVQPGHSTLCLNYCPIGYTASLATKTCIGTQGIAVAVNFDNNLAGDFTKSGLSFQYGMTADTYYPDFDFQDPVPANQRGIYLEKGGIKILPVDSAQSGRIMGTDWTIEIWASPKASGSLFSNYNGSSYRAYTNFIESTIWTVITPFSFEIDSYGRLLIHLVNQDSGDNWLYTPVLIPSFSTQEWGLYAISLVFNDVTKTTQVNIMRNTYSYTYTAIPSYYREEDGFVHFLGANLGASSYLGFMYSFTLYTYGRTTLNIQAELGTCTSCSACPTSLNSCIPLCNKNQYVDSRGICQQCDSSCTFTCVRESSCNLCYEDLCYECNQYSQGTCTKCVEHATLTSGTCQCSTGYVKQDTSCKDTCDDGYYLDLTVKECLSCPSNCKNCNASSCLVCYTDFILNSSGVCTCSDGWFIDETSHCSQCDTSCATCVNNSSYCTSCIESSPILMETNICYPCASFQGYGYTYVVPIGDMSADTLSQLAVNCTEICGDMRHMGNSQCDDGNNKNGDGCSSVCAFESGWSCSGGTTSSSDVCIDTTPPVPLLAYLSKTSVGYTISLSFSEPINVVVDMSKNIEITVGGITKFEWSISLSDSIYKITLNMYDNVSTGTVVTLTFIKPGDIVDLSGNAMVKSSVKVILPTPFSYGLQQALTTSVTTATSVAAVGGATGGSSAAVTGGALNLQAFWGMVEMMQITNYLIFLSPKYPENVKTFLSALNIANGNFLPNPFQTYVVTKDPFPSPPAAFLDEGFNTDFMMNAGQFLFIWMIILAIFPISLILYRYWPRFRFIRGLKSAYQYSILLRTGIESFLEITLAVFLQWRLLLKPDDDIGYASIILSFMTIVYIGLTYGLIIWKVTLASQDTLNTEKHAKQYGTLYEGFKRDSKVAVSFLLFQHSRRVIFVILCIYLYEYPTIQVALSTLLSFAYTLSLILIRPFEKNILGNALHISSEVLFFSAHCIILKFLDDQMGDDERTNLGWVVVVLLGLSLVLHLIANLVVQVMGIISLVKAIKEWCTKRMGNRGGRVYKRKGMLDTIILDSKVSLKKKAGRNVDNSENMAYFEGKKTNDGGFSFRESKVRPETEHSVEETMGDESYKREDSGATDTFDESFSTLTKKKKKSP